MKHSESPFQKIGTKIGTSIRNIFDNFGNLFKNEEKINKSYEEMNENGAKEREI